MQSESNLVTILAIGIAAERSRSEEAIEANFQTRGFSLSFFSPFLKKTIWLRWTNNVYPKLFESPEAFPYLLAPSDSGAPGQ
jgi:hypothetical protein